MCFVMLVATYHLSSKQCQLFGVASKWSPIDYCLCLVTPWTCLRDTVASFCLRSTLYLCRKKSSGINVLLLWYLPTKMCCSASTVIFSRILPQCFVTKTLIKPFIPNNDNNLNSFKFKIETTNSKLLSKKLKI